MKHSALVKVCEHMVIISHNLNNLADRSTYKQVSFPEYWSSDIPTWEYN